MARKFNKGGTYVEQGGMWAGMRWRIAERWQTGNAVFVRLDNAMRSKYAQRVAASMTARVTVKDGIENCRGGFYGRITA